MTQATVIATRESRLALWQAEHVRDTLVARFGLQVELLGMTTRGDQILDRALSKVGGKGLFVKELETALEEGRAHLAVHSLKDVPMDLPAGFVLAAIWEREDPRDAFVSPRFGSVDELPQGAVVGTSSLRRVVQLLSRRPDLRIEPLRGNLDTRLRKLDEGGFDAIVLAAAGLKRLGLASRIRSTFDPGLMIPAAGQGALGIEVREDATELRALLAKTIHRPTFLSCHAERAVSRSLGGSCSMPLAAHAVWVGDTLRLDAALGDANDPRRPLLHTRLTGAVTDEAGARALGNEAATRLRAAGAGSYLPAAWKAGTGPAMRLIVTRPAAQAADWVRALQALGQDAVALPLLDIGAVDDPAPLRAAWGRLAEHTLVMFVSANAVLHFFAAAPAGPAWPAAVRAGCTGPGTAAALRAAGVPARCIVEPPTGANFDSEALWALLAREEWSGRRVLVVRGEDGRDWLAETLRARGAAVDFVAAYRRRAPQPDAAGQALLARALAEPATHLWLFSSSEGVTQLRTLAPGADWSRSGALASHPRIAQTARELGFARVALTTPVPAAVAALAAGWASIQSDAL